MGLLDFIKGQFIDVISWLDDSNNTLCWRFPDHDNEIKRGAKLTVREGQVAIFVSEGEMADVFPPGLYTLTTENIPILTSLKSWKYGFESPFKAEVYFVNTRQYIDMKWGTAQPILLRDPDFGIVRVRAHGIYAIQVVDAPLFFKTYVGTDGHYTTEEIEGALRSQLVSSFTTALGQGRIPVLELAGNYDAIAKALVERMDPEFQKTGLALRKLVIDSISLPPEVEKAIDARSSMGALGNLQGYTQYQAAQAIRDAAQNPGAAGGGIGIGAGLGMGQMLAQTLGQSMAGGGGHPPPPAEPQFYLLGPSGQQGPLPLGAAAAAIRSLGSAAVTVWSAGMPAWKPWQEVPALAAQVGPPPSAGPPPLAAPSAGPPPLEPQFHYSSGQTAEGPYPLGEIVRRIQASPQGTHKVWREGMSAWADATTVGEIAVRLKSTPPPL